MSRVKLKLQIYRLEATIQRMKEEAAKLRGEADGYRQVTKDRLTDLSDLQTKWAAFQKTYTALADRYNSIQGYMRATPYDMHVEQARGETVRMLIDALLGPRDLNSFRNR